MNDEAEASIFKLYRPRLLRACMGFLGELSSEAQDIVHDCYLVALPNLTSFPPLQPMHAWLRQICLRLSYSRLRNPEHILCCLEGDLDSYRRQAAIEAVGSDNLEVREQQQLELLRVWIKRLKPEMRLMIELRNMHAMSYASIGETLEISRELVEAKLLSARQQLRQSLARQPQSRSPSDFSVAA
jgi:RNA polymerase sigma-70 factor (ECF subfamily)